jgi:hypothetical protein
MAPNEAQEFGLNVGAGGGGVLGPKAQGCRKTSSSGFKCS